MLRTPPKQISVHALVYRSLKNVGNKKKQKKNIELNIHILYRFVYPLILSLECFLYSIKTRTKNVHRYELIKMKGIGIEKKSEREMDR